MPMIYRPERRKSASLPHLGVPPGTAGRLNGTASTFDVLAWRPKCRIICGVFLRKSFAASLVTKSLVAKSLRVPG
jgi:hypothetical protein